MSDNNSTAAPPKKQAQPQSNPQGFIDFPKNSTQRPMSLAEHLSLGDITFLVGALVNSCVLGVSLCQHNLNKKRQTTGANQWFAEHQQSYLRRFAYV